MRIAYIVPSLKNRAPVQVVRALATVMTQHGHTCCVYYFDDGKELDFPCETQQISMMKRIPINQYDVVHTHCLRSNLYVFLHKTLKTKSRYLMTAHSFVFEDFIFERGPIIGRLMAWLFLLASKRHDKIIALSENAISYYNRWIPREKLTCIYNCVLINPEANLTEEERKDIEAFGKDRVVIGTNCWLQKVKGLDVLIKALAKLPERFCLYFVGEGDQRAFLEQLCDDYHVKDRTLFAGEKAAAYRYLPFYDIFVMGSYTEGFSLSLLEAALYGKPCVSSDLPDIVEKFPTDEVVYFPTGNVVELAKAILQAEGNLEMGKRAKKKAEESYSVERFYKRHMEVYRGD